MSVRVQQFRRNANSAIIVVMGVAVVLTSLFADEKSLPPPAKSKIDFEKEIRPLFKDHCLKCHGPSKQDGGLRLDRRDDALNGGDNGPMFVSGKSAESRIIKYVAAVDTDVVMPPEGERLTDKQIGLLRAWIDQGGIWPVDK